MFSLAIWKTCSPLTLATFFNSGTASIRRCTPTVAADPNGQVARMYREIARKAAAQLSLHARSKSIQFPKIVIQNT